MSVAHCTTSYHPVKAGERSQYRRQRGDEKEKAGGGAREKSRAAGGVSPPWHSAVAATAAAQRVGAATRPWLPSVAAATPARPHPLAPRSARTASVSQSAEIGHLRVGSNRTGALVKSVKRLSLLPAKRPRTISAG